MKKQIFVFLSLIISLIIINACATISEGKSIFTVLKMKCVGCGDCVKVCPVQAIEMYNGKAIIDQKSCVKCGLCETACTFTAIRKLK